MQSEFHYTPRTMTLPNGDTIEYKESYEICYHKETPDRVVYLLHVARTQNTRLKITYGDTETGKPWEDEPVSCYIGRSNGNFKVPLVIKTARSTGGEALLDHCIVKIEYANKKDGTMTLYDITK